MAAANDPRPPNGRSPSILLKNSYAWVWRVTFGGLRWSPEFVAFNSGRSMRSLLGHVDSETLHFEFFNRIRLKRSSGHACPCHRAMRSTLTDASVVAVYLPLAELLERGRTIEEGTRCAAKAASLFLVRVAKDSRDDEASR
jgi:hypothetical protein